MVDPSCCHEVRSKRVFDQEDYQTRCKVNSKERIVSRDNWSRNEEAQHQNTVVVQFSFPKLSVAKLSLIILALATVTDTIVSRISPSEKRPRSSIGSVAIASVTETFSPILPFTGGLDLRRRDYWHSSESWLQTLRFVTAQVKEAFSGVVDDNSMALPLCNASTERYHVQTHNQTGRDVVKVKHVMAISITEPFISVRDIADLTLGEVGETVNYAIQSGYADFDRESFLSSALPRLRKVIDSMDEATAKSRAYGLDQCIVSSSEAVAGEIDALMFVATLRVFAEWRIPRQVPDGYKGFAVGMNLGYKDVVQNLVKIEQAVHAWMDHHQGATCGPSLRQLLEFEANAGQHKNLPRLKEKTGAMGLLWVRRQLDYQSHIFANFLEVPKKFRTTEDGVMAAYKEVYDQYHGWAVQKIFSYSFQAAPKSEEIFKQMNPHKLKEVSKCVSKRTTTFTPLLGNSASKSEETELSKSNHFDLILIKVGQEFENMASHLVNEWDNFATHVGSEWDKLASNLVKLFNKNQEQENTNDLGTVSVGDYIHDEEFIVQEMIKDAREQIGLFLESVNPLRNILSSLFADMNMDDPTKV